MKVFTRDYRMAHYESPEYMKYFKNKKPCVLDIETTGLSTDRSKIILIALLTETADGVRITQFLAQNHYEEYKVLNAALEFIREEKIGYLITFNGLRFDIPFINRRLAANGFSDKLTMYHFDLYRFLRKYSGLAARLSSLSQVSVERYYGIACDRKDTITGRESISLFNEYALDGNGTVEKIILTHNREDVLQLYRLMCRSGARDFGDHLRTDFHSSMASYGFPSMDGRFSIRPSISKDILVIKGDQLGEPVAAAYFPDENRPITAIFKTSTATYEISVPLMQHAGNHFIDVRALELENALESDPDCVNGFLIINSRTTNIISRLLVEKYTT